MELACETEVSVQPEHSLYFSIISKPVPIFEYLKSVSTLVRASHILGIYEENDTVKIYFDDKRSMDTIIKTGIHVMGHHVKVDYVVPPGIKIFLSNIDPVITNMDLMELLSGFGTVVSPIIRMPLYEDAEFCHIDFGVRYVYMELLEYPPNKLEFKYGDRSCIIKISLTYELAIAPSTKLEGNDSSDSEYMQNFLSLGAITAPPNGNDQLPVVVGVHSADSGVEVINDSGSGNAAKRAPAKRRRRFVKTVRRRRAKLTATSQAARKIKKNVKYKLMGRKPHNRVTRLNDSTGMEPSPSMSPSLPQPNSSSAADGDASTLPLLDDDSSPGRSSINGLSDMKLGMFINEVKFRRAPFELLNKYLGSGYDSEMVLHLIEQLKIFKSHHKSNSLKLRLGRVIKMIEKAL